MNTNNLKEVYRLLFNSDLDFDTQNEIREIKEINEESKRRDLEIQQLKSSLLKNPYDAELKQLIKRKEMFINIGSNCRDVESLEQELKEILKELYIALSLGG